MPPRSLPAGRVGASNARCRSLEVPPDLTKPRRILAKTELGPHLKAGASFIAVAEGVITPVCRTGPQQEYIYILCDSELVALKIFAAPEVLVAAEKAGVKPGTVFTEESCGTNALALAREYNRFVAICGEQHYCAVFKDWWGVAAPVKDPNGKTLGYLDISMHGEKKLGLAAALLQTLVARVEDKFVLDDLRARQRSCAAPAPSLLPPGVAEKLTTREREVLGLLLSGLSSREIAAKLCLSVSTVENYRKQIYQKLGVKGGIKGLLALLNCRSFAFVTGLLFQIHLSGVLV